MAIIQISQIKHRRGLRKDLPYSLEEGELGLALDTGELFIGTPSLPAAIERTKSSSISYFPYKNTQILTEWTDNVKNTLNYKYRFRNINFTEVSAEYIYGADYSDTTTIYTNSSGKQISFNVSRKLQERLDENVSVKSYGALGNGQKDLNFIPSEPYLNLETNSIRKAATDVSNITNNDNNPGEWKPRSLLFPAGVYCINDSLLLPPNSHWIGEGKENTIIVFCSSNSVVVSAGFNDAMIFTVDGNLDPLQSHDNNYIKNYSYQNIINPVENIIIENITFINNKDSTPNKPIDILRLIRANNVLIKNCSFIGKWSDNVIGSASPGYEIKATSNSIYYYPGDNVNHGDSVCVVIDSFNSILEEMNPKNIKFIDCDFINSTYGTILTDDIKNIEFINCKFNRLYRGVSISESLLSNFEKTLTIKNRGPKNIKLISNNFYNIKREGIYVGNYALSANTYIDNDRDREYFGMGNVISIGNNFDNVGNDNTNYGNTDFNNIVSSIPVSYIINFDNARNVCSIGDIFSRSYNLEKIKNVFGKDTGRINFSRKNNNIIINSQDFIVTQTREILLSALNYGPTGIIFSLNKANGVFINYTINIVNTSEKRIGKLKIISNSTNSVIDDDFIETNTTNITFNTFVSGNEVELYYNNPLNSNFVFSYTVDYWEV
jgi:hypothetical protein